MKTSSLKAFKAVIIFSLLVFFLAGCGKMSEYFTDEKDFFTSSYEPPVPLSAPQNISATDGVFNNRVEIAWDSVYEAQFYRVYRSDSSDAEGDCISGDENANSFTDLTANPGGVYYYRVKAFRVNNQSDLSDYDSGYVGTYPDPPPSVTASKGTYEAKVDISWESVSGADYYWVYRATSSNGQYAKISADVYGIEYEDPVSPGPHYFYKIKAVNSGGQSDFSISAEGYALVGDPLSAPTGVSATDREDNDTEKVSITWNIVDDAEYYRVYRSLTPDGEYVQVGGDVSGTSCNDYTVYEDVLYYYRVKAFATGQESEFSDYDEGRSELTHYEYLTRFMINRGYVLSKLTKDEGFPPSGMSGPFEFHIEGYIDGNVDVTVTVNIFGGKAVTDFTFTGYNDFGLALTGAEKTDTDFGGTGTNTGTVDTAGSHSGSVTSSIHVTEKVPDGGYYDVTYAGSTERITLDSINGHYLAAPGNISATMGTYPDRVDVIWIPVYGANYYRVYRSDSEDGAYEQVGGIISGSVSPLPGTVYSYSDATVDENVHYYYKVRAFNSYVINDVDGDGDHDGDVGSPFSDSAEGYAQTSDFLAPPSNVRATDGTFEDKIRVTWDSAANALYYRVYRSDASTGPYTQIAGSGDIAGTSYDDTLVVQGTIYYYRVKSFDDTDESDFSNYDSGIATSGGVVVTDPPANVSASDNAFIDRVELSWSQVDGATSYRVYRSDQADGTYSQVGSETASTTFTDTSVGPGKYYYRVRAIGISESELSDSDSGYRAITKEEFFSEFKGIYDNAMGKLPELGTLQDPPLLVDGDLSGVLCYSAQSTSLGLSDAYYQYHHYNDGEGELHGVVAIEEQIYMVFWLRYSCSGSLEVNGLFGVYSGTVDMDVNLGHESGESIGGTYTVTQPGSPAASSGEIPWDYM